MLLIDNKKQGKLFRDIERLERYCEKRVKDLDGLDKKVTGFSLVYISRLVAFSGLAVKYGLQSAQYLNWGKKSAEAIKNGWYFLKASAQGQVRAIPLAKSVAGSGKAITKGVGETAMKFSVALSAVFLVWDTVDMISSAVALGSGKKHELSIELSKTKQELKDQYEAVKEHMEKQGIMQD